MKNSLYTLLVCCLIGFVSCSKTVDTYENKVSENDNGTLSATINGNPYVAAVVAADAGFGDLAIRCTDLKTEEKLFLVLRDYDPAKKGYTINVMSGYTDNKNQTHKIKTGQVVVKVGEIKSAMGTFEFETEEGVKVIEGKFDVHWD